jgi:hypothetical protein
MQPETKITGSNASRLTVLQTPFCGDLRSKKLYMTNTIPATADDIYDASGHTWCYHTQMPVGPDGYVVGPDECGPSRKCYRSALAKPAPYVVLKIKENPEI